MNTQEIIKQLKQIQDQIKQRNAAYVRASDKIDEAIGNLLAGKKIDEL